MQRNSRNRLEYGGSGLHQNETRSLSLSLFIDKAKHGDYTGVLKGAEFKNDLPFFVKTIASLNFGLIFVGHKLNPANNGGSNFRKITPLAVDCVCLFVKRFMLPLSYKLFDITI